jgi:hypothetical protein
MPVRATSSATAHDHPAGTVRNLDPLDLHPLEDLKVTAAQIAKIRDPGMMDERQTARPVPAVMQRKWMWISRKMPTRMRWRR